MASDHYNMLHQPDDFSDEDIDSDDAFDSEDEKKYGWAFKKNGPSSSSSSERHPLEDEQDRDDEEDQDDEYNGVVSILDMINQREAKKEAAEEPQKKHPKNANHEASNDDDDDSDNEDPNLGDHEALLKHMERIANGKKSSSSSSSSSTSASTSSSSSSSSSTGELTADDLLSSLRDSSGVTKLKQRVDRLESGAAVTTAPKARIHRVRAERKLGYVQAKQDATDWTALVTKNRQAEHTEFGMMQQSRVAPTTAGK